MAARAGVQRLRPRAPAWVDIWTSARVAGSRAGNRGMAGHRARTGATFHTITAIDTVAVPDVKRPPRPGALRISADDGDTILAGYYL